MTMSKKTLLIGVDVGGTNTDSVLIDPSKSKDSDRGVLAWNKSVTTKDVSDGIYQGISHLLQNSKEPVLKQDITSVTIGTTHFINAVVEQDQARLAKVAVLRLCGPYSRFIPPFADFPKGLRAIIEGYIGYLDGGFHVDGREIQKLSEVELLKHVKIIKDKGIKSIAIVGIFSPMKPDQEIKVKEFILRHIPDAKIVLSHRVSGTGYLFRENASVLNASILPFAEKIIYSFTNAIKRIGLNCPVLLTQNDGTVLSGAESLELPIRTFSSGATNSMRGASFLGGVEGQSAIVVDVGGTTSDVGLLLSTGFPRQSSSYCTIGGVKMNFSMPHVESIGLGGGSIVNVVEETGAVTVGPESTGAEIIERALIFGGNTITASDIAISLDSTLNFGDATKVEGRFSDEFISSFRKEIKHKLEKVIDRMKTNSDEIIILAVGGGSFLVPSKLEGASEVIRPSYHDVANAIGAAMGKLSTVAHRIERLNPLDGKTKEDVLEDLKKEVRDKAVAKGAIESTIDIVFESYDPVPYIDNTFEFFVQSISDIDYENLNNDLDFNSFAENGVTEGTGNITKDSKVEIEEDVDFTSYKPFINQNREWEISEIDLEFLRIGSYILGCGGGGNPYANYLLSLTHLRNGDSLKVVDVKDIKKYVEGEGSITGLCNAGSPTVSHEQLAGDGMMTNYKYMTKLTGVKPTLIFPIEIGGNNGLTPFRVSSSSRLNLPVVDCDLMGRAYPTHFQTTPTVYTPEDEAFYPPTVISNGNGNTMIVAESKNDFLLEKVIRASLAEVGSTVEVMNPPMTVKEIEEKTIHGSISLAWRIGRAVRVARQKSQVYRLPEIILESVGNSGALLFEGKIVGVERRLFKGHIWGEVIIQENTDQKRKLKIPFKNENIFAEVESSDGSFDVICSVPDLITVVDAENGEAVGTPDYRYGLLVFVLGIAPSNHWTDTKRAIEIGGPKGFDLDDIEYKPVSKYVPPVSVIDEYSQKRRS